MRNDLQQLEVPYLDARASQLRLRLGPTSAPALLTTQLALADGVTLLLEVLGSSHRVTLNRDRAEPIIETVACDEDPTARAGLVAAHDAPLAGLRYAFRSSIEALADPLAHRDALLEQGALVGAFPGHPGAFTAILADTSGYAATGSLGWSTWHAYPQSGELVVTTTALTPEVPA